MLSIRIPLMDRRLPTPLHTARQRLHQSIEIRLVEEGHRNAISVAAMYHSMSCTLPKSVCPSLDPGKNTLVLANVHMDKGRFHKQRLYSMVTIHGICFVVVFYVHISNVNHESARDGIRIQPRRPIFE